MEREMGNQDAIDIIMATHNNQPLTARCIETLYHYTKLPFRLTVIDDSTDLTPTWIAQFKASHDNIFYIRPEEKLTCGNQIMNIGLKHTTSDIVCNIVNSVMVEPMWLEVGLQFMMANDNIGLMGFKLLKPYTSVIEHAGIYFAANMAHHMNRGVGEPSHHLTQIDDVDGHGLVGWALTLFKRKAVPEGGFDEKTYIGFRGYDDLDNCLTMRENGWQVVYNGYGVAYHFALATRGSYDDKSIKDYETNRKTFKAKWDKKVSVGNATPVYIS